MSVWLAQLVEASTLTARVHVRCSCRGLWLATRYRQAWHKLPSFRGQWNMTQLVNSGRLLSDYGTALVSNRQHCVVAHHQSYEWPLTETNKQTTLCSPMPECYQIKVSCSKYKPPCIYIGPVGYRLWETREEHLPYNLKRLRRMFTLTETPAKSNCYINTIEQWGEIYKHLRKQLIPKQHTH